MLKVLLHLLLPMRDKQASELLHVPQNHTSSIESVGLQGHDFDRIAALKEENNFQFAMKIWEALVSTWGPHQGSTKPYQALYHMVYTNLVNACSRAVNVDLAIRVFAHL